MNYQSVIDEIKRAKTIAIISHVNPDGDTVGSSLAIYKALEMYGKKPYIFCDDNIEGKISVLSGIDKYNVEKLDKYDLSIAVDCADVERMGYSISEFKKGKRKIDLDHHKTNNRYGDVNLIDVNAAASAQIVTFLLDTMKLINDDIARLLFSGLVTDSGGFSFSSVTSDTLLAGSILMKYNIKGYEVFEHFLKKTEHNVFKLKSKVLEQAKFYDDNTIGIVTFRQSDFAATGTTTSNTEGIINNIININGVKVAVAICEVSDKNFKISVRTGENVDSSRIALMFGGGGHKNAAGFRINGFYEDVVDKILKAVRDELCC